MTLLDEILTPSALTTLFQPIIKVGADGARSLHGYEALTRGPRGTNASRADVLFEYVRRKRAESVVDRVCALAALRAASLLPHCPQLSLNVHAATLGHDAGFAELLIEVAQSCGFRPEQIVVEVVEQSSRWSTSGFTQGLATLREAGVRIALDDLGFGHSNLYMMIAFRPDIVKIDRYFVSGIANDAARQAVLRSVQLLASAIDCTVVAEGVEHEHELDAVRATGISLMQGFLFSPPQSAAAFTDLYPPRPSAVSLSA